MCKTKAAFERFWQAEYRGLLTTLRMAGWRWPDADDALQEAMLATWLRWDAIDDPRRYALHVAFTRVRVDWGGRQCEVAVGTDVQAATNNDNLAMVDAEFTDEAKYVQELLDGLAPQQREVMALTVDGFTPAEIAGITGQNASTVRSHLRHARHNLAGTLDARKLSHASQREVEQWMRHRAMRS